MREQGHGLVNCCRIARETSISHYKTLSSHLDCVRETWLLCSATTWLRLLFRYATRSFDSSKFFSKIRCIILYGLAENIECPYLIHIYCDFSDLHIHQLVKCRTWMPHACTAYKNVHMPNCEVQCRRKCKVRESDDLPCITSTCAGVDLLLYSSRATTSVTTITSILLIKVLRGLRTTDLRMAHLPAITAFDTAPVSRLGTVFRDVTLGIAVSTGHNTLICAISLPMTSLTAVIAWNLRLSRAITGDW